MQKVARAYDVFKTIQLRQAEDMAAFAGAKSELKARLTALDELLNRQMYGAVESTTDYDAWLRSHQPFHWLAEFYEIINDRGGFDVIIGNPPYVEISKNRVEYNLSNYITKYRDLYGYILTRVASLSRDFINIGMIIPISFNSTDGFVKLFKYYMSSAMYISCYADSARMFQVTKRLSIVLKLKGISKDVNITKYIKCSEGMQVRLANTPYTSLRNNNFYYNDIPAKISSSIEKNILEKLMSKSDRTIANYIQKDSSYKIYYTRSIRNFRPFYDYPICHLYEDGSIKEPTERKEFPVSQIAYKIISAYLNSNLVFMFFCLFTDVRNINPGMVLSIPLSESLLEDTVLNNLNDLLMEDYEKNKIARYNRSNRCTEFYYLPKLSKPIIDEIDKILAVHYGFTEEELDFIINYDIKYRMGDELNEE